MKCFILSLILVFAFGGRGLEATPASRSRGVELLANDGSLRARIVFDRDKVLLDFPIQQRGYLFEAESFAYLNHAQSSYRAYSYSNLLADIQNWAHPDEPQRHTFATDVWAGLKPTGKNVLIAGFNATQFVRMSKGKIESEIWICESCSPVTSRAVREEIRRSLPVNYWSDDDPTLFQTVLTLGVPLRIVEHGREPGSIEAMPIEKENLHLSSLETPPEYTQLK